MSGTGIDVVPNLPKCPVPVLVHRTYRSVLQRYCCTELTEASGTGNTGGIYRRYASVRTVPNTPVVQYAVQNVLFGLSTKKQIKLKTESLELEKRQMLCIS